MNYQRMKSIKILKQIHTEEEARQWVWRCRFEGKDFFCPQCEGESYWQHHTKPEVRECDYCRKRLRLRAGTIFESSKHPLLTWIRAINLMMQGKRGISALELKRHLGISDHSAWLLLQKIREGLRQRDENYTLKGVIEVDGASFGKGAKENQVEVLVAVETKEWVDEKGRKKEKAGFAKVKIAAETKREAQEFADQAIQKGAFLNSDGAPALRDLKGFDVDYQVMSNDPKALDHWLPWVHKFISNAKAWIIGTHHGVDAKYLGRYLSEYAYRFNRRHDLDSLFHRALTACAVAKPMTARSLCA